LFTGGGRLPDRYAIVRKEEEALLLASSASWERFVAAAYNEILIGTLQEKLKAAGISLFQFHEELAEILKPLSLQIATSKWRSVTRFPFEALLSPTFAEFEFCEVQAPAFFVPEILPVLRAGHYPCGWIGESYPCKIDEVGTLHAPTGQLQVFLCD
jgi:hypothetical protein